MGIRTELSTNPAMLLGGLKEGVTPLEMAFAYSTLANSGKRVCAEWASYKCGPVAIKGVEGEDKPEREDQGGLLPGGRRHREDDAELRDHVGHRHGRAGRRVRGRQDRARRRTTATPGSAASSTSTRPASGSATRTRCSRWRPSTPAARWPAAHGPASIWQSFMLQAIAIRDTREAEEAAEDGGGRHRDDAPVPVTPTPAPAPAPEDDGGATPRPSPRRSSRRPRTTRLPRPHPRSRRRQPAPPQEPAPPPGSRPPRAAAAEPGGAAE